MAYLLPKFALIWINIECTLNTHWIYIKRCYRINQTIGLFLKILLLLLLNSLFNIRNEENMGLTKLENGLRTFLQFVSPWSTLDPISDRWNCILWHVPDYPYHHICIDIKDDIPIPFFIMYTFHKVLILWQLMKLAKVAKICAGVVQILDF